MDDLFQNHPKFPNPKVKAAQRMGISGWAHFHAAFSEDFALSALNFLKQKVEKPFLFDPFAGSGTSLQAARRAGIPILAADLDPVAALITRAKASYQFSEKQILQLIKPSRSSRKNSSPNSATLYFDPVALDLIATTKKRISDQITSSGNIIESLINSKPGTNDNEVLGVTALLLGASNTWKGRRTANPTWQKAVSTDTVTTPIFETSKLIVNRITTDLKSTFVNSTPSFTQVLHHDATTKFPPPSVKPNLLLTSPPYLTRLDYIKNHLSEIHLLNQFQHFDIDFLRNHMVGTPTVAKHLTNFDDLGEQATALLKEISAHPSYASERYYMPFYRNYFTMLKDSLKHSIANLSNRSHGIIVVQQSRYKDIIVDLPGIITELLGSHCSTVTTLDSFPVGPSLSTLNPKHNRNQPARVFESVIYFEVNKDGKQKAAPKFRSSHSPN